MDSRYHVNLRLGPDIIAGGAWEKWAIQWAQLGSDGINPNNVETGKALNGITLIDPESLSGPAAEHMQ